MKTLEEAKKLDPEAILEEIRERRVMIGQMVGWLYRNILEDEIEVLHEEYARKKYGAPAKP